MEQKRLALFQDRCLLVSLIHLLIRLALKQPIQISQYKQIFKVVFYQPFQSCFWFCGRVIAEHNKKSVGD